MRSGGQGEVAVVSNLFVNQPSIKSDGDGEAPGDERKEKTVTWWWSWDICFYSM